MASSKCRVDGAKDIGPMAEHRIGRVRGVVQGSFLGLEIDVSISGSVKYILEASRSVPRRRHFLILRRGLVHCGRDVSFLKDTTTGHQTATSF